jgi:hypothetical protein
MKTRLVLGLAGALLALECGSTPDDPTALGEPIAQGVVITRIAMLQSLEVPIMQDGAAADRGNLPLIALRDSELRVFVSPDGSFSPHELTARARIVTTSPMGSFAQVFSGSQTIAGDSTEDDLSTTIQIPIPGTVLEPGASITVVLNDTTGDSPDVASSDARWPQDGSAADLDVRSGGDLLRVMIVPVQYNADGSHRLPDTSDTQLEAYRERFYQLYPAATVEITVHDPWPWASVIDAGGNGMSALLMALGQLRGADNADPDLYYYAAFEPASSFGAYCGGACVTGLSLQGAPTSVGIGYSGDVSTGTAVHEVGHAHGLAHAPCGPVSPQSVDQSFPYPDGSIGLWGYDPFGDQMIDPSAYKDMMGYCSPIWISDYHYAKIFSRVRSDNHYYNDWMLGPGPARRWAVAPVAPSGAVRVSYVARGEPWIERGSPRQVTWDGGSATGYFFPYDHLPGGELWLPNEVPAGARVTSLRAGEIATTIARP